MIATWVFVLFMILWGIIALIAGISAYNYGKGTTRMNVVQAIDFGPCKNSPMSKPNFFWAKKRKKRLVQDNVSGSSDVKIYEDMGLMREHAHMYHEDSVIEFAGLVIINPRPLVERIKAHLEDLPSERRLLEAKNEMLESELNAELFMKEDVKQRDYATAIKLAKGVLPLTIKKNKSSGGSINYDE